MLYAAQLHREKIREITRAHVADVIATVARDRGTTSAQRTKAALQRFWGWMVARGHPDHNIVAGTEGYAVERRSRVLTDGEIAAIWRATEAQSDFNMIVRLCLWLGTRRSEPGGMAWSELVDGLWHVPGSRTKNHRPLILPLPRQVLEALESWPRVLGKDNLFGRGPNGFQAWSQSKRRLDINLGYLTKDGEPIAGRQSWDLHDIRRTVEARLIGLGVPKDHVNPILNHAQGPMDEAYNRYEYLREKELALKSWAAELDRITTGDRATVIALRSAV
jgi:integrase